MSVKTPIHVNCWNHRIIHDNSNKFFWNTYSYEKRPKTEEIFQKVPNYFSMNLILHFYLSLSENQVYRRVPEVAKWDFFWSSRETAPCLREASLCGAKAGWIRNFLPSGTDPRYQRSKGPRDADCSARGVSCLAISPRLCWGPCVCRKTPRQKNMSSALPCGPAVIFLFWTRMKFQKETLTRTKWEYDLNRRGAWVRSVDRFFTILSASLAIGFLHLTILQNHWVNIFSTINTLPHPKALGFIINLFVNHHTPTTVAFRKSFFHPSPPLERGSFIRVVDLKIPGATILSILKMRLWKLSFNRLGRNFRRHNLLILRRRQIRPFGTGLKATLRINPEQTPGFRPGIVEGLIKPHPGGEGSMKFPPPLVLFGMKF